MTKKLKPATKKRVTLDRRDWNYIRLCLLNEGDYLHATASKSRARYVAEETEDNRLRWIEDQGRLNRIKRIIEEIGKTI